MKNKLLGVRVPVIYIERLKKMKEVSGYSQSILVRQALDLLFKTPGEKI